MDSTQFLIPYYSHTRNAKLNHASCLIEGNRCCHVVCCFVRTPLSAAVASDVKVSVRYKSGRMQ